jgi:hypothetical protein
VPDLFELGQLGGVAVFLKSPRLFRLAELGRQFARPYEEVQGGTEQAQADHAEDEITASSRNICTG